MELHLTPVACCAHLPLLLQIGDSVDKRGMRPRFGDASRLFERDHVSGGLFHNAEAVVFQLTDDCRLPGTGRPGHNESLHEVFHPDGDSLLKVYREHKVPPLRGPRVRGDLLRVGTTEFGRSAASVLSMRAEKPARRRSAEVSTFPKEVKRISGVSSAIRISVCGSAQTVRNARSMLNQSSLAIHLLRPTGHWSLAKQDSVFAGRGAVMADKVRSAKVTAKPIPEIEGNPVRNRLLLGLPSLECDSIYSQLAHVELRTHDVIEDVEEPIKYGYFVNSGLISVLSMMEGGKSVEVGISGNEGCTALPVAVGLKTSVSRLVVQIQGTAFRIPALVLARFLGQGPVLERRMQQYGQVMAMQGAQIAACNRLHEVEERLARWLLMTQDRIGGDMISLTHEFLAHMLGTRRSSVTVAAGSLQKAGLITYNRGSVKIENRERLEDAACECYNLMRRHTAIWEKESI
jgi:CRP-like cAMP-binding protein